MAVFRGSLPALCCLALALLSAYPVQSEYKNISRKFDPFNFLAMFVWLHSCIQIVSDLCLLPNYSFPHIERGQ